MKAPNIIWKEERIILLSVIVITIPEEMIPLASHANIHHSCLLLNHQEKEIEMYIIISNKKEIEMPEWILVERNPIDMQTCENP